MAWKVYISKNAAKKAKKLPEKAKYTFRLLWKDLETHGSVQISWPSYGKLKGAKNRWHCHLKKGRPTYVVCWRLKTGLENEKKEIEIYYAWTHEDAPY